MFANVSIASPTMKKLPVISKVSWVPICSLAASKARDTVGYALPTRPESLAALFSSSAGNARCICALVK